MKIAMAAAALLIAGTTLASAERQVHLSPGNMPPGYKPEKPRPHKPLFPGPTVPFKPKPRG